jgi:RHS repeat-associated protein
VLELNDQAAIISYEEYHPYGTTAYRANDVAIKCTSKRYRNSGKEWDAENGMYYHGARYYPAWLGRWISVDPLAGKKIGQSPYDYCNNNPVNTMDKDGFQTISGLTENNDIYFATPVLEPTAYVNIVVNLKEVVISAKYIEPPHIYPLIQQALNSPLPEATSSSPSATLIPNQTIRQDALKPPKPPSLNPIAGMSMNEALQYTRDAEHNAMMKQSYKVSQEMTLRGTSNLEKWANVMIPQETQQLLSIDPVVNAFAAGGVAAMAVAGVVDIAPSVASATPTVTRTLVSKAVQVSTIGKNFTEAATYSYLTNHFTKATAGGFCGLLKGFNVPMPEIPEAETKTWSQATELLVRTLKGDMNQKTEVNKKTKIEN